MSSNRDLAILDRLPPVKVWGERLDESDTLKTYRGKFVVTDDGKFFAKLYPALEWENIQFFHDNLVQELGIKDAEGMDVKEMIVGGGKIELEFLPKFAECRLYGKSTIYGDYDPFAIDTDALAIEIQDVCELGDWPVDVIADYEP